MLEPARSSEFSETFVTERVAEVAQEVVTIDLAAGEAQVRVCFAESYADETNTFDWLAEKSVILARGNAISSFHAEPGHEERAISVIGERSLSSRKPAGPGPPAS
jgi:hypothetical protein